MTDGPDTTPWRQAPEGAIGGEGPPFDQSVLAPNSDAEIEQAVRTALALDPDLDPGRFAIQVEDGVVSLIGPETSEDERRRAVRAAGLVHGVQRVVDQSPS